MPPFSLPDLSKLRLVSAIDILAVAILIYNFIVMIRGRRAAHVLNGIWILLAAYLISVYAHLDLLRWLLAGVAPYTAIALIVMFQAEIRRVLARIGRIHFGLGGQLARREVVDDIVPAVQQMAEAKTGVLIVVEREIGLRTFIESGVSLDARVSRDLLCSIFERGGALHDGAVIIQGDRVAAAACFLPLSTNPAIMRRLGTRHRAAIGVTEDTDALAIVVSEETGQISLAVKGTLEPGVTIERVRERLTRHAGGRQARMERTVEPEWRAQS
ncbi:MAG TPA: diadenylate cyclase CdaA [Bryobacteraceae bacterium]|jgi:diadenylate cyclase